jgi:hypothetical protein
VSLEITKLIEAEREARRLVGEAEAEVRWIRRAAEKEITQLIEVSEKESANMRRRLESAFEQEKARLLAESDARVLEDAGHVQSALATRKQAAVEKVVQELTQ